MCCESVELAERTAPGPPSAAVDQLMSGPVLCSPPHTATIEAACAAPPVESPGNAPRTCPPVLRDVAVAMQQHVANQEPAVLLPSSAVPHNSAPLVQAAVAEPSSAHQVVRSPRRSRLLALEPMDAAAAQQDNGARTARVSAQPIAAASQRPCQRLQKDSITSLGDTAENAEAEAPDTARASSALALETDPHRCNTATTASAAAPGHIARPAAEPAAVKKAPIASTRAQPPRSKSQPRAAERACAASPAAQPGLQSAMPSDPTPSAAKAAPAAPLAALNLERTSCPAQSVHEQPSPGRRKSEVVIIGPAASAPACIDASIRMQEQASAPRRSCEQPEHELMPVARRCLHWTVVMMQRESARLHAARQTRAALDASAQARNAPSHQPPQEQRRVAAGDEAPAQSPPAASGSGAVQPEIAVKVATARPAPQSNAADNGSAAASDVQDAAGATRVSSASCACALAAKSGTTLVGTNCCVATRDTDAGPATLLRSDHDSNGGPSRLDAAAGAAPSSAACVPQRMRAIPLEHSCAPRRADAPAAAAVSSSPVTGPLRVPPEPSSCAHSREAMLVASARALQYTRVGAHTSASATRGRMRARQHTQRPLRAIRQPPTWVTRRRSGRGTDLAQTHVHLHP